MIGTPWNDCQGRNESTNVSLLGTVPPWTCIPIQQNGRTDLETQEMQCAGECAQLFQFQTLRSHIPSCPETRLGKEFITVLSNLDLHVVWSEHVPQHLGYCIRVDLAAQALIAAMRYQSRKDTKLELSARSQYGRSLTALQASIDLSDTSLMAVGLLSLYEGIMQMHSKAHFSHRYGIARILLSRRDPGGPSELARGILYSDWETRFHVPLAKGTISPFDDPYWLNASPPHLPMIPLEIFKLCKLTNQLIIRLPRLILHVRQLRSEAGIQTYSLRRSAGETTHMTEELLQLQDEAAESQMLHNIRVVKTWNELDLPVVSHSFQYGSLLQMTTAIEYWQTRLILIQLCLKLVELQSTFDLMPPLDRAKLKSETLRMLTNIFMSWQ